MSKGHGPHPPVMQGKAKHFGKAIGELLKFCRPYWIGIVIAMALSVAGAVMTIVAPDILGELTNTISDSITESAITGIAVDIDMDSIAKLGFTLLFLFILGSIFTYIQGYIMAVVNQRVSQNMRGEISKKVNRLPFKYFDSISYGDVLSRVTNDVDLIGQTLNHSIVSLTTSITLLFGVLIMMFVTNWIMALTAIGASLIGFVLMSLIMARSQKYFFKQQQSLGKLNGHIEEIYSGHNVVKAYNAEEDSKEVFRKHNEDLYTSGWKSQFFSGLMMPLMGFIGNFGYVAICVVGAVLVADNKIQIGVIVSFMMYVRLFTQPLSQIAQAATSLQSTAAASERVFEFLSEKELEDESNKTMRLDTVKGDVEFDNVRFGYNEDRIIINGFSAKAKSGQKIAIVGPTGAGKTTMVNLLMRFYELNSGSIKIDGVPIDQLTRDNVHSLFGMVLQDTWIFEGTIRDNIIYSKQGVTEEDLHKACKAAGVEHFINTMPNGYDTVLDDNTNLSAGQKQLITIARAMIENAPMLILDEATSSVDTRTEVLIQEAMDNLMKGRTSFVIAHRLSTIKNADLILVMKDGDIIENGNHEQLIEKGGFYAELYNSQFAEA